MVRFASFVLAAVAVCCAASISAQTTALDKQLSRIDLGVSAAGEFTKTASGTVTAAGPSNSGTTLTDDASTTVGAHANLRYVAKPLVGFELNFGYARYTENFSYPPPALGVQTNVNEFTVGYLITPDHQIHGLQPYVSVGAGSTEFKPTPNGGVGLRTQARMTYYYSVGVQQDIFGPHLGLRAGFRQKFFLAPDFGQNYFTNHQHTFTSEPTIGFYVRF